MRKSPATTTEVETKFSLRVPESTYKKLRKACDEERRSINSQVVLIIDEWLARRTHGSVGGGGAILSTIRDANE